jgi:hypothetical protein
MRRTLHHRAPNTYYGQWLGLLLGNQGQNREANARNGFSRPLFSTACGG